MVTALVERFRFGGRLTLAVLFVVAGLLARPATGWAVRTRDQYTTPPAPAPVDVPLS
jgi:hypothetical protein